MEYRGFMLKEKKIFSLILITVKPSAAAIYMNKCCKTTLNVQCTCQHNPVLTGILQEIHDTKVQGVLICNEPPISVNFLLDIS